MRWTALALLVGSTGCNWFFGLTETVAIDAGDAPEVPPGPRTRLVWAVQPADPASITPVLAAIGSEAIRPGMVPECLSDCLPNRCLERSPAH